MTSGDGARLPGAVPNNLSALIDTATVRDERLPILEVICDRLVRSFSTNMRHLTSEVVDVHLYDIGSSRFGDGIGRILAPAMYGLFRVPEWDGYGVIAADAPLSRAVVEALLGGGQGAAGEDKVGCRPATSIEVSLVSRMMRQALADLADAFQPIAPVSFELERVETNPKFASVADPSMSATACRLQVEMEGRGGSLTLLLPQTTLEPVRDKLVQRFFGERLGRDGVWEAHFEAELRRTSVQLRAVIAECSFSLGTVQALAPGQLLRLGRAADEPLTVIAEGMKLATAQIGQRNGRIAVRLLEDLAAS